MQNFEVKILKPKAANILYDLQEMKLIRLKETKVIKKKSAKRSLLLQIEKGLKDVSRIRSGKTQAKSLKEMLHGK